MILNKWLAMNPIARYATYGVVGVLLGLLLTVTGVPDGAWRVVVIAVGTGLVASGLGIRRRRNRTRVTVLGAEPETDKGECRYCGRAATASIGYTRRRGGRILTCSTHTHLAVAEATR